MSFVQIRLRRHVNFVIVGSRRVARHGLFGNITMLPSADALALIEAGAAKLPRHMSLAMLRARVEAEGGLP